MRESEILMLGEPIIRSQDEDLTLATWDWVLIQIWHGNVTSANIQNMHAVARGYIDQQRAAISSLAIVEPTSPAPNDKVRGELSSFYREFAPRMKEQIVVPEGSGFRAALVRGVGITLSTLAPRSLPFRFVSTVREAAFTIGPHLSPQGGGAEGLLSALEFVRATKPKR